MEKAMEIGKISHKILEEVILNPIKKGNFKRQEVLVRPFIGEDCACLNIDNEYIVLSSDPITLTDKEIGKLAVNINSNDIFASGSTPIGIMVTILLPPSSTKEELQNIVREIYIEANKLKIEVLGGHTEVTSSVIRPVISCTIIGKTNNKKFISTSGAIVGQKIVMTKWAGLEGTNIILSQKEKEILNILDINMIKEFKEIENFLSIEKESKICLNENITCMHDVTEGGVIGACLEIAKASNVSFKIFANKIPLKSITDKLCKYFNINPYKLISSGVLIATTFEPSNLLEILSKNNINSCVIGEICERNEDNLIYYSNKEEVICNDFTDEINKIIK